MNKFVLEKISSMEPSEQKRMAYIEGRGDLFETKILRIKPVANEVIDGCVAYLINLRQISLMLTMPSFAVSVYT